MIIMASQIENIMKFFAVLVAFVFVLVITYMTTKWIGGYQKNHFSGRNIEYIEGLRLDANKYIQIFKVGGEYVAFVSCKDSVTFLTKINKEDLILDDNSQMVNKQSFGDVLEKLINRRTSDKDEMNEDNEDNT
ncbi:MAG: hypothetical protein E7270_02655 [Lachnospiraceae bacterium]|nr:hypothetical protein [Lachnospiraceae bacterium]MBQ4069116.1 flagellar biosynthetic protein FliO [Lachnospiraceae bacterium]